MDPMTFSIEKLIPLLLKDPYLWRQPMQLDHEQLRKWKFDFTLETIDINIDINIGIIDINKK